MISRQFKTLVPSFMYSAFQEYKLFIPKSYSNRSYSQDGEDMILNSIFDFKKKGFYVDIGAHHPKRFSNTYFFYKKGWSGINVDAMPGSMKFFKKIRARDINIEAAIAKESTEMTFFIFDDTALNTFERDLAQQRISQGYKIVKEKKIFTTTLQELLSQNLVAASQIDFMSIDVEGLDLEVIQSNNWQVFRPNYLLIECLNFHINNIQSNETYKFLREQGYDFFAKTCRTLIFQNSKL